MIGSCNCCNAQDVEVSRAFVTGIETFACNGCRNLPEEGDKVDTGSLFITREDDGDITIRVRSPGSIAESKITVPFDAWNELRKVGP